MLVSESDAAKLLCPMLPAVFKITGGAVGVPQNCRGSGCMMWTWLLPEHERVAVGDQAVGRCGLCR